MRDRANERVEVRFQANGAVKEAARDKDLSVFHLVRRAREAPPNLEHLEGERRDEVALIVHLRDPRDRRTKGHLHLAQMDRQDGREGTQRAVDILKGSERHGVGHLPRELEERRAPDPLELAHVPQRSSP